MLIGPTPQWILLTLIFGTKERLGKSRVVPPPLMNRKSMSYLPVFQKYMKDALEKSVGFMGAPLTFQLCNNVYVILIVIFFFFFFLGVSPIVMWQQSDEITIKGVVGQLEKVARMITENIKVHDYIFNLSVSIWIYKFGYTQLSDLWIVSHVPI